MSRTTNQMQTLLWTAAGVVVAGVIGVITIALMVQSPAGAQVTGGGTAISGSTGVTVNNDFVTFQQQAPSGSSPAEVRAAAQRYTDVAPPAGPAPFRVVDAGEKGLKVRTTGTLEGTQVGSAADGAVLWASCRAVTDFDPVLTDDIGAEWLLVQWPTAVPGSEFRNSEPGSPERGWVYAGYTVPAGHNGRVPEC